MIFGRQANKNTLTNNKKRESRTPLTKTTYLLTQLSHYKIISIANRTLHYTYITPPYLKEY